MTLRLAEPEYGLEEEEVRTAVHGCVSVAPVVSVINAYASFPPILLCDEWTRQASRINAEQVLQQTSLALWRIML
jgi:hypothetical protein